MLENWCWEQSVLQRISSHHRTQQPLPSSLITSMLQAKNVNAGMCRHMCFFVHVCYFVAVVCHYEIQIKKFFCPFLCSGLSNLRQLVFGQFDMICHTSPRVDTATVWSDLQRDVGLIPSTPNTNRYFFSLFKWVTLTLYFLHPFLLFFLFVQSRYFLTHYGWIWCRILWIFVVQGVFKWHVFSVFRTRFDEKLHPLSSLSSLHLFLCSCIFPLHSVISSRFSLLCTLSSISFFELFVHRYHELSTRSILSGPHPCTWQRTWRHGFTRKFPGTATFQQTVLERNRACKIKRKVDQIRKRRSDTK